MSRKRFFIVVVSMCALLLSLGLVGCGESSTAPDDGGAVAAEPKTYTIERVDGAPNWSALPQADIDTVQWTDDYGIAAHAQVCYDDTALYVHMWAEEQDIRAEWKKDDPFPSTYEDSCLEFFFMPIEGDARYVNFEFNPNCAVGSQIGIQKTGRVWITPADDSVFNATSDRTENGWEIYYELPFEFIQSLYPDFAPKAGTEMRGNFYKCGNLTKHKHYLSWNPIDSDKPNFHVPASFGILVFG